MLGTAARVSLPSIVPPAPEKLLGVSDLSLVGEGREDLVETNSQKDAAVISKI